MDPFVVGWVAGISWIAGAALLAGENVTGPKDARHAVAGSALVAIPTVAAFYLPLPDYLTGAYMPGAAGLCGMLMIGALTSMGWKTPMSLKDSVKQMGSALAVSCIPIVCIGAPAYCYQIIH